MKVYAYLVVQKQGRAEDLAVLEKEERLLSDYAAKNSMLISEWVRERNYSQLKNSERKPAFNKLLEKLQRGDSILFPSFSSFTSSPRDALEDSGELLEKGVRLHFLDLGGEVFKEHKDLLFKVFETFANQQRPVRRLRAPTVRKIPEGEEYKGGVLPYGYKVDKKRNVIVEETWRKAVIQLIAKSLIEGLALRPICDRVQKELKIPISTFTVKRLRDSEEVKNAIEAIKKIDQAL